MDDLKFENYNFFMRYRDPDYKEELRADIEKIYRKRKYADFAAPDPDDEAINPQRIESVPGPAKKPLVATTAAEKAFLASKLDEYQEKVPVKWKSRKLLGKGHYGICGLWERDGEEVAVKQTLLDTLDLRDEGDKLWKLTNEASTTHVTRLICQPKPYTQQTINADGIDDRMLIGKIMRLILEYCPLGSLCDLLERRIKDKQPFEELTLWRIFNCFADGLAAMEFGRELTVSVDFNDTRGQPVASTSRAAGRNRWDEIVHFDLKPDNILLGNLDASHVVPVAKIGDFGVAETLDPAMSEKQRDKDYEKWRTYGTPGYLVPEQFSERWDYIDWKQSKDKKEDRIAGQYQSKTNVWGIGVIMSQLVMLSKDLVDHTFPFLPKWRLSGKPAQGRTYCVNLHAFSETLGGRYPRRLTDFIYRCLYEKPALRPSASDIKIEAEKVISAILAVTPEAREAWESFVPPEPLTGISRKAKLDAPPRLGIAAAAAAADADFQASDGENTSQQTEIALLKEEIRQLQEKIDARDRLDGPALPEQQTGPAARKYQYLDDNDDDDDDEDPEVGQDGRNQEEVDPQLQRIGKNNPNQAQQAESGGPSRPQNEQTPDEQEGHNQDPQEAAVQPEKQPGPSQPVAPEGLAKEQNDDQEEVARLQREAQDPRCVAKKKKGGRCTNQKSKTGVHRDRCYAHQDTTVYARYDA